MATITGGNTDAGYKIASTFGTAVQAASGDKLVFDSLTHSTNPAELSYSGKGSGADMLTDAQQGALSPSVSLAMKGGYENAMPAILATFLGADSSTLQTDGYQHRMTHSSTLAFGTVAFETSSTTVVEYPSAYVSDVTITAQNAPNYLDFSANFVCGDRELSTSVNTNANLASATLTDGTSTDNIVVDHDDDFWINSDSGALDSGDLVSITRYVLNLSRPKAYTREIKGSSGLSAPLSDGLMTGTLEIELASLADHTYFTAAAAGTTYKSSLTIEGTSYGTDNRTFAIYLPLMKLIQDPEYNVTEDGNNPHVLRFQLLAASAAPTGMNDTTPYFEFINSKTAAYL